MAKRNVSQIESGAGFSLSFANALMDTVREKAVPFAAIYRLATAGGRSTLGKIVDLAYADWHRPSSRSPKSGSRRALTRIVVVATATDCPPTTIASA